VSLIVNIYILLLKKAVEPSLGVYKCLFVLIVFLLFTVDVAFFTHGSLATLVFCNLGGKKMQFEEIERIE